ncbi:IS256 family transposase [Streptomyces sp. NPDC056628]|uniref:IS256 family transposase n=1 Tax=Streptomyces sp. NPDC056628 TaxID=3345882 RepID=UPI0036A7D479
MLSEVNDDGTTADGSALTDEIVRESARRMLAAAQKEEVNAEISEWDDQRDANGRRLVVRNGYHRPRKLTTAVGAVEVKVPRVNDKLVDEATGERKRFSSAILPPWCRKSSKISEVLLLYRHGLSSGDFVPSLERSFGSSAGLSPATVTRLTTHRQADHAAFMSRDLAEVDYVYTWADGIHLNASLNEAKACVLVLTGVRTDGSKELVALRGRYRKSGESWADLLRGCARRDMRAPVLAVGGDALGLWKALAEVLPATREQRYWVHRTANVLDAMPKSAQPAESAQPAAKKAIQNTYNAEDRDHAKAAVKTFAKRYGAKPSEVVRKTTDNQEELLAFFDFPAEHWIHLRTTNPIESSFSIVRPRRQVTRGAGLRIAAPAMVFKLVESAQARWRAVNAPHLVALVRVGARFEHGQLVERPGEVSA